ncbi:hypothetical protein U9M48_000082 [Paspalum notatum var. saurae]|uniref:Tf2-1-like SH3-like domain-containing protein n=1 Tax=Paspalum notatum var. saurae TaxID=547442 RepID=A0AAQ3SFQ2_PASNO
MKESESRFRRKLIAQSIRFTQKHQNIPRLERIVLVEKKEAVTLATELRLKSKDLPPKSYAYKRRRELIFEAGEFVYLKVSSLRGTERFHTRGKLAPRYVGPYKIKKKIGDLAYELELPQHLSAVYPVFHVSRLRKCLRLPEDRYHRSNRLARQHGVSGVPRADS